MHAHMLHPLTHMRLKRKKKTMLRLLRRSDNGEQPIRLKLHTLLNNCRTDSSKICNPRVAITDAKTMIPCILKLG